MRGTNVHGGLALVINPLEGVVVRLTSVEAVLAEVKVAADLAVVAGTVDRHNLTPSATVGRERERGRGREG